LHGPLIEICFAVVKTVKTVVILRNVRIARDTGRCG
jgi:hypothetical protein